jgi:nicotinamide mononucleotide transporter
VIGELAQQLLVAWRGSSWLEIAAVVLALLYVLLAVKQSMACWYAAFVSSCLYVLILFSARLYMESVLNLFYALMAAYGWWNWRRPANGVERRVIRWPIKAHLAGFCAATALSVVTAFFLRRYTPAAWPFLDSWVTWTSVFATYLVTQKVYENWHWWFAIDALSAALYFTRHLYATMLLFALYLVLIVFGLREWRRALDEPPRCRAAA